MNRLRTNVPLTVAISAALAGAPVLAEPDCPGDADASGAVDFGDVTTVLGNWLAECPPPPIDFLGDQLANPQLVNQVINSPLTQQFGATFNQMGLNPNFQHTSELFYGPAPDLCPVVPNDAVFLLVPVVDQSGLAVGFYAYTASPSQMIEGADYITFFDPNVDPNQETIRVHTAPNLQEWLDITLINDCDVVVTSSENPGVPFPNGQNAAASSDRGGSYLQCLGMGIAPKILLARGLGLDQACIFQCKICAATPTPITCAGCAGCAAVAVGIIAHVWWCCP